MDLNSNYKINEKISWTKIDDQILILDSQINESAHELNEIGSYIFLGIKEGLTPQEILIEISNFYHDYDSKSEIEEDVIEFLNQLIELNLVEKVS